MPECPYCEQEFPIMKFTQHKIDCSENPDNKTARSTQSQRRPPSSVRTTVEEREVVSCTNDVPWCKGVNGPSAAPKCPSCRDEIKGITPTSPVRAASARPSWSSAPAAAAAQTIEERRPDSPPLPSWSSAPAPTSGSAPAPARPTVVESGDAPMIMIVNHVFIGRASVKPSDLFNILTWVSIGATVNIYVAHPDGEQHNIRTLLGREGLPSDVESLINIIDLRSALDNHNDIVPGELKDLTRGWKDGIIKFLDTASEWWPSGEWNPQILEKLFTVVDATKFYLSATKQGLVCDMKVAPTKHFWKCEGVIRTKFISYQRGNAAAAGFENQLSGSMCEQTDIPRITYAEVGRSLGSGFGGKDVAQNARAFEQITACHGRAMDSLVRNQLGIDSTKTDSSPISVIDPQPEWKGPVRVFKHPKDQSWRGVTLSETQKTRAKRDIDDMAKEILDMMTRSTGLYRGRERNVMLLALMNLVRQDSCFNIYAE